MLYFDENISYCEVRWKEDFLAIADLFKKELEKLLELALSLKKEYFSSGNPPLLKRRSIGNGF